MIVPQFRNMCHTILGTHIITTSLYSEKCRQHPANGVVVVPSFRSVEEEEGSRRWRRTFLVIVTFPTSRVTGPNLGRTRRLYRYSRFWVSSLRMKLQVEVRTQYILEEMIPRNMQTECLNTVGDAVRCWACVQKFPRENRDVFEYYVHFTRELLEKNADARSKLTLKSLFYYDIENLLEYPMEWFARSTL